MTNHGIEWYNLVLSYMMFWMMITMLFYLKLSGKFWDQKLLHQMGEGWRWKRKRFKNCCFYIPGLNMFWTWPVSKGRSDLTLWLAFKSFRKGTVQIFFRMELNWLFFSTKFRKIAQQLGASSPEPRLRYAYTTPALFARCSNETFFK